VDSVPDPLLLRKSGTVGNRTQDLSVSSQELWPLDRTGGQRAYERNLNVTAKSVGTSCQNPFHTLCKFRVDIGDSGDGRN
jgi:hypothetical protein